MNNSYQEENQLIKVKKNSDNPEYIWSFVYIVSSIGYNLDSISRASQFSQFDRFDVKSFHVRSFASDHAENMRFIDFTHFSIGNKIFFILFYLIYSALAIIYLLKLQASMQDVLSQKDRAALRTAILKAVLLLTVTLAACSFLVILLVGATGGWAILLNLDPLIESIVPLLTIIKLLQNSRSQPLNAAMIRKLLLKILEIIFNLATTFMLTMPHSFMVVFLVVLTVIIVNYALKKFTNNTQNKNKIKSQKPRKYAIDQTTAHFDTVTKTDLPTEISQHLAANEFNHLLHKQPEHTNAEKSINQKNIKPSTAQPTQLQNNNKNNKAKNNTKNLNLEAEPATIFHHEINHSFSNFSNNKNNKNNKKQKKSKACEII